MKRFSLSQTAIHLALLGATAAIVQPAHADRAVSLAYRETPAYARITAKWGDGDEAAPKITAAIQNQVLILHFDQKVTLDFKGLTEGLPSWAAITRIDPDGMTARIGLKQASRLHISSSIDLAAIDLVPEAETKDPPDIVSPLVAKRAADAEAKRIAAIPPPPPMLDLEVRGSHSGDSSRVAFYWPQPVSYKVVGQGPGMLKLQFARRAKADIAYLRIYPPPNLADKDGFTGENTDKGYLVTLTSKDRLPIKHFLEGDVLVIDITRPAPPEEPHDTGDGGKAAARPAAKPAAPPKAEPIAAKPPEAGKPGLLLPPKDVIKDEGQLIAEAAAKAQAELAVAAVGGPERVTAMTHSWSDPAPKSGVVDVKVSPLASGVELRVEFPALAPAAVFARGSAVWAVFAANADLKIDQTQLPAGYRVRPQRTKNATMMRIEAPKGVALSAESEDTAWTIRLAPTARRPLRFLKPEHRTGGGRARIETNLIGAAGIVWFEDPVIGDQLAVAVAYGPSSASPSARDYVEALLPATAHGLAIAPKADDVIVTLENERVIVSMMAGAQSVAEEPKEKKDDIANAGAAAFIDYAAWGGRKGESFYKRQAELERTAADFDPATAEGADKLMDLARFLLGHELAQEAIGVMRIASSERPDLEQDPHFLGLRGAANVMADRLKTADDDLARGPLRNDPSAALWRGLIAAERGEWERALDFFRAADDEVYAYPPQKAARFTAAWAEAALNANDFETARKQATQAIATGAAEDVERGQLVLASLTNIIDGAAAAYPEFERLSKQASRPVAVRAELKRLELAVPAGVLNAKQAADELESLRFNWRGDDVEMATVGILADQYMRVGRFRDALLLAQSTALRDANAPGARELRIKSTDYFRRLYLDGEAGRLDPIQALALFYEFNALTPISTDGDQMVRKLAQRLVAFDLLGPASELLQYQIDNRMRGLGKATIAVDLARIYLLDKRPDRALAAINSTRQPQIPKELAIERRLLEAAAYLDLGRFDHVIELVEPLEGVEAKSLLAEAHWRGRNWSDAAKAYLAMLPPAGQASAEQTGVALKGAIAGRMAKDPAVLGEFRRYLPIFEANGNKASFDLITSQGDAAGAALSEAVRRLADAPRVDAFAAAMKQRLEVAKPAAAPAAAPAAQPAAPPNPPAAGKTAAATPAASGGSR